MILLHGLNASAEKWRELAQALTLPDTIEIVLPQAPVCPVTLAGSEKMPSWFDIYGLSEDSHEDQTGILNAHQDLQALINDLKTDGIPAHNIVIGGFSQGGALALHFACHSREPLAGVLALSAYLPLRHTFGQLPLQKLPVFLSHGIHDEVIPLNYAETTHRILKQHQFVVDWNTYPLGHALDAQVVHDINCWLNQRWQSV